MSQSMKRYIPEQLRWNIFQRDGMKCVVCSITSRLTIDHIFPEALGGDLGEDNLRTICRSCNSKKSSEIEWDIVPERFKPKQSPWQSPRCIQHGCDQEAARAGDAFGGPYCERHFLETRTTLLERLEEIRKTEATHPFKRFLGGLSSVFLLWFLGLIVLGVWCQYTKGNIAWEYGWRESVSTAMCLLFVFLWGIPIVPIYITVKCMKYMK